MLKELLQALYEKLELEEENDRKNKNGYFDFFEEHILKRPEFEEYKKDQVSVTSKTMKNYYEKYVEERSNGAGTPKKALLNLISEYLEYKNYEDFIIKNRGVITLPISNSIWKKTVTISLSLFITLYIAIVINENHFFYSYDCIVWKGDHYEKTSCTTNGAIDNTEYKINIKAFRKKAVDTSTIFFTIMKDNERKENYWYGKNREGKGEFFTHRGIHPETKKELEPVSRTILYKEGLLNE
ncbi:hypothetical protein [Tenacibaculum agarivorans]|uniref:hypothetical protein n=1 Tax=Tenacibaculum agarivorans TaxID=1908389 RepID=UPI00094B9906|nr:hypothetical protein [Tenacibaculum agarivorans]